MSLQTQHDPKNEAEITYWNSAGGRRWVERQQSQDIVLGPILQATLCWLDCSSEGQDRATSISTLPVEAGSKRPSRPRWRSDPQAAPCRLRPGNARCAFISAFSTKLTSRCLLFVRL